MGAYRLAIGSATEAVNPGRGAAGMMLGMLFSVPTKFEGYQAGFEPKIRLHTGDPGANFTENKAKEEKTVEVEITKQANYDTKEQIEAGRKNLAACTWLEVSEAETYKWIVLMDPLAFDNPVLAIELTAPVIVVKGDTFVINIGSLVIKPKLS